ncbi:MAG: response regulator transcription factor [Bacillota bacterium]
MTTDKILIVEDEEKIARFLELELEHEGYEVEIAYDGRTALEQIEDNNYSLVLLDIMLPKLNGMEVCRRVRKNSEMPIIMLTAKDDTMDKVMGLDLGAYDYMTKPFDIEELLARTRGVLRRNNSQDSNSNDYVLSNRKLEVNTKTRAVTLAGQEIELTKKEYDLLVYLLQNEDIVLKREQIVEEVWGYDYTGNTNIVDVYIRYLRTKIDDKFKDKYIETIRGVGYVIKNK